MEFFAIADRITDVDALQARIDIGSLPVYCASISRLLSHNGDRGEIYCTWGQFIVHRESIHGGVRFTLPKCPNALAWTITTGFQPALEKIVIHCTINRAGHDADFIVSILTFVQDWQRGLEARF